VSQRHWGGNSARRVEHDQVERAGKARHETYLQRDKQIRCDIGKRSVGKAGCCGLTGLRCDEMRKCDGDETTQRWLDVVGGVVAVGAKEKGKRKKANESKQVDKQSGARRSGLVVQVDGGVRRWAKVRVLA
jgi:hypothetical protein